MPLCLNSSVIHSNSALKITIETCTKTGDLVLITLVSLNYNIQPDQLQEASKTFPLFCTVTTDTVPQVSSNGAILLRISTRSAEELTGFASNILLFKEGDDLELLDHFMLVDLDSLEE